VRRPELAGPLRAMGRQILWCGWGLLVRGARVSAEYRATRAHYSSPEFWRAYLKTEA
jgi:hypothetical protein